MDWLFDVEVSVEAERFGINMAMAGNCLGRRIERDRAVLVLFLSSKGAICEAVRLNDMADGRRGQIWEIRMAVDNGRAQVEQYRKMERARKRCPRNFDGFDGLPVPLGLSLA